jgi:hypothetical protein
MKKLHLCACARLSSRSLGKIGSEIAVLSLKYFYCQGPRTLFHYQETAPLRSAKLSSLSLGKICAEMAVLSCVNFYCQGPRALFHNQETAPLRMRQTELSLSSQDKC